MNTLVKECYVRRHTVEGVIHFLSRPLSRSSSRNRQAPGAESGVDCPDDLRDIMTSGWIRALVREPAPGETHWTIVALNEFGAYKYAEGFNVLNAEIAHSSVFTA